MYFYKMFTNIHVTLHENEVWVEDLQVIDETDEIQLKYAKVSIRRFKGKLTLRVFFNKDESVIYLKNDGDYCIKVYYDSGALTLKSYFVSEKEDRVKQVLLSRGICLKKLCRIRNAMPLRSLENFGFFAYTDGDIINDEGIEYFLRANYVLYVDEHDCKDLEMVYVFGETCEEQARRLSIGLDELGFKAI